jgi:hypothetical protein
MGEHKSLLLSKVKGHCCQLKPGCLLVNSFQYLNALKDGNGEWGMGKNLLPIAHSRL